MSTGAVVDERSLLSATWQDPRGFFGWLKSTNHKSIGLRWFVTGFSFFILGAIEAGMLRTQLRMPENDFLTPSIYNQMFTMHGTTMLLIFGAPTAIGIGLYLIPLMIGARGLAFPRLAALSYWMYLFAGAVLYIAFFAGVAPDAGWFNYVPLTDNRYSPGVRIDFWLLMIFTIEAATAMVALNLMVTFFKHRAPGMTLNRVPVFVWAIVITAFLILFSFPVLLLVQIMLELDRSIGTVFFKPFVNGLPLLWQQLFWFFGHPVVYVLFVPGLGILSQAVEIAGQRCIYDYTVVIAAEIALGVLSFTVFMHHMFVTGIPSLSVLLFGAASFIIIIPSTIQVYSYIVTVWNSRPRYDMYLLFSISLLLIFTIGGLNGLMLGAVPFNTEATDTYFVLAHIHYVIWGTLIFPLFGAIYLWYPKVTGKKLSWSLGLTSWIIMLIGFNLTFFVFMILGTQGMARRVYTYPATIGWGPYNFASTIGSYILFFGIFLTLVNMVMSRWTGREAGPNPFHAGTFEFATSSPPASYNFEHIPLAEGRYPLWYNEADDRQGVVVGLRSDRREVLVTSLLDAEPQGATTLPGPSWAPLAIALAIMTGMIGYIFVRWFFILGAGLTVITAMAFLWPRAARAPAEEAHGQVSGG